LTGLAEMLVGFPCESAVIDGELVFPTSEGHTDFRRLQAAMASDRQQELAVFAFDLMHHNGEDLRPLPLIERRLQLTELLLRSDVHCLHLVQAFDNGVKLLDAAEEHGLEGIVSKHKASTYRSGPSRDWVKAKTVAWRKANRDRWKAFQRERQRNRRTSL